MSIGNQAPDFEVDCVYNGGFHMVCRDEYAGSWLLLVFYMGDFMPVSQSEIIAFDQVSSKFIEQHTNILPVSRDSLFSHKQWINTPREQGGVKGIALPLVADIKGEMSASYDVVNADGVTIPTTFLLDPDGIIRWFDARDVRVGRNIDHILHKVTAFQQTHGSKQVGCTPANWKPGDSIIPSTIEDFSQFPKDRYGES